jgi:hypothetical protein
VDYSGMTPKHLQRILEPLDERSEFAVGTVGTLGPTDALLTTWRAAAADAREAYADWHRRRDRESFAVYRAFADRADAAQDALALRVVAR